MNSSPAAQVEKVLEDLIVRLTKSPSTADVRAVLIEAKRLRNVTMRWSAIPPQPDARREMMARVMDLIAQIGLNAKDLRGTDPPPLNPPSRPPPKRPPTAPPPRPISRADASPTLEPKVQPARQDQAPSFRKFEELGQTRPRAPRAQESAAPRTSGPHSLRISQKPTVPPAPGLSVPTVLDRPRAADAVAKGSERSLSPIPGRAPNREQSSSSAERSLSPLPSPPPARAPVPPPKAGGSGFGQRALSPMPFKRSSTSSPVWRVNPTSSEPVARPKSGQHEAVKPPSQPTPSPEDDFAKRPTATLQFGRNMLSEARTPQSPSLDSEPPPTQDHVALRKQGLPSTQRAPLSTAPPPLRNRSPHRAATIAGIPEANEAMIAAALRGRFDPLPQPEPFDEVAKRSSLPTLTPPPIPTASLLPSSAPPALRRLAKETLQMGALTAVEALEAFGITRPRSLPRDLTNDEHEPPPSTKPSNPPESDGSAIGIQSIGVGAGSPSGDRIDGLSTKISRTDLSPIKRASQRPPPSRRDGQPSEHAQRLHVAPGIAIVKPSTATWQSHQKLVGVTQKVVHRDPRSGLFTALFKLAPGAQIPRRRHAMTEEVYVVSGVASFDGQELEAGDYLRAEAETIHPAMTTKHGCTLFVIGSEHDEVLDED